MRSKKVILRDIKSIKKLEFELPSKHGVKLLVGTNGVGKTTLLIALARIGVSYAFKDNYKAIATSVSSIINPYKKAKVSYEVNGDVLTYEKNEDRWKPSPSKRVNNILSGFGYSSVKYIKADANRIQSITKEIWHGNLHSLPYSSKIGNILENDKFNNLVGVKLHGGRVSPLINLDSAKFYPDAYFSTGELCIFNIVKVVEQSPPNSLILIDEVDMSLHPKVQMNLLRYLQDSAMHNNLTIIISTHSVNIIKQVNRQDIYYLEDTIKDGNINVVNPCYHAYALRGITIADDIDLDYVFLVEDDKAKQLLSKMIDKFLHTKSMEKPVMRILPIGGWSNVMIFYDENRGVLGGNRTKVFAFLDEDAFDSIEQSEVYKKIKDRHMRSIKFLPITPEKGLVDFLKRNHEMVTKILGVTIEISLIINKSGEPKKIYNEILESLSLNLNEPILTIESQLYKLYSEKELTEEYLLQTFGPLIN